MGRKTKEELNAIKAKYGVEDIWSWSRYNTYKTSPYEFFLSYVEQPRQATTRDNIYGILGNSVHDILEGLYDGTLDYDDMLDTFNADYMNAEMKGLKFDRSDDEKNDKIAEKYSACVRHFCKNHKMLTYDMILEQYLIIKIDRFVFGGYFDALHKDEDGNYIITDWKTSTLFTGKKIDKSKGQLVLYAEGIRQMLGVPMDKIKVRWNFLKYMNITMPQKNGKTKITRAERHIWFGKVKNNAKMWMKHTKNYTDQEIDDMLDYSLEFNTISNLPKEIQDLYVIEDCYVYADFTQEEVDILKEDIVDTLTIIEGKRDEYNKTKSDESFWEEVQDAESYYFANLCGFNANQHKPYGEYLDKLNMGVDEEYKPDKNQQDVEEDWMSQLGIG